MQLTAIEGRSPLAPAIYDAMLDEEPPRTRVDVHLAWQQYKKCILTSRRHGHGVPP